MNRVELINAMANETTLSKKDVEKVLSSKMYPMSRTF